MWAEKKASSKVSSRVELLVFSSVEQRAASRAVEMAAWRVFYMVVLSVEYSVASKVVWLAVVMDGLLVDVWVAEKVGQMGHY